MSRMAIAKWSVWGRRVMCNRLDSVSLCGDNHILYIDFGSSHTTEYICQSPLKFSLKKAVKFMECKTYFSKTD